MTRSFGSRIRFSIQAGDTSSANRHSKFSLLAKLSGLAVLIAFTAVAGFCQDSASLSGTVKDSTGAVVPSATITVTSVKTAPGRSVPVGSAGGYAITGLAPGTYTITTSAPGFATLQQQVTLAPGQAVSLDLTLAIAQEVQSVSVSGATDPYSVVSETPTDSVFGLSQTLDQIPRAVTNVDSALLNLYSAHTVNDLVTVVPGSFTGAYFGIPGSVFLRGDIADNYFRGFRRVENRGNYETPLDASDHIEVVAGPPSPIYGPGRIGGFMNFYPKTVLSESAKWMDKGHGAVEGRFGQYSDNIGSAEYGLPFKVNGHRAGAYVFFEDKDSGSFYKGVFDKYIVGQLAIDMELSPKWRLAGGFQGFNDQANQALGWNRVTQTLINTHMYQSGSELVNLSSNGKDIGPQDIAPGTLSQYVYQQNWSSVFNVNNFGSIASDYMLNPASMKLVKLPLNQIMVDTQNDFLDADTDTAYFDVVGNLRSGLTFKNQSFYDRLNSQKFSSYGFGADYRPWVTENKSTVGFNWHPNSIVAMNAYSGFDFTRVQVSAGEDRNAYQAVDRRDLSVGPTANDRFEGPWNSNGQIGFQYFQIGVYTDYGLFWLSDVDFWNKLMFTIGARLDRDAPDFWGRDGLDDVYDPLTHAKAKNTAGMVDGSISYRFPFHLTPYFTVATSRFFDLGQGNELDYSEIQNGQYLEPSTLYEAGVKTDLSQKFFGSLAFYHQKRSQWDNQALTLDFFTAKGAEMELRAFLLERLSLTGAFTWQEPQELNAPTILAIPVTVLGLTPQQGYGGKFLGTTNVFLPPHPAPYAVAGQPHWVASPFATVNATKNAGVLIGMTWAAAVQSGYVNPVVLPAYSLWRGSIFYNREKTQFNLGVNNLFNETYFQSQYLFEDSLVKPGVLRTIGGSVRYTF